MGKLKIGGKTINIESDIRTKHMRKMLPFMNDMGGKEIDMTIEIAKVLFIDLDGDNDVSRFEGYIDELLMSDMTKFIEFIGKIITEASKKKS